MATSSTAFNIPARLDPESLDLLELWLTAGVMTATPDLTANAFLALRGTDFQHPALETVVRAVDRTLRAGRPRTPANLTQIAGEQHLVEQRQLVLFERLLHEILETSTGPSGIFLTPAVVYQGATRTLGEVGTRAVQAAEQHHLEQLAGGATPSSATGIAIAEANSLADTVDALAEQLHTVADRLRLHVAAADKFTVDRTRTPQNTHQEVAA